MQCPQPGELEIEITRERFPNCTAEQLENGAQLVADMRAADTGHNAAISFAIGAFNALAEDIFGKDITHVILRFLNTTVAGKACLHAAREAIRRKDAENRAMSLAEKLRAQSRAINSQTGTFGTYMTWPVELISDRVRGQPGSIIVRYLTNPEKLAIVERNLFDSLPPKRRTSQPRPA